MLFITRDILLSILSVNFLGEVISHKISVYLDESDNVEINKIAGFLNLGILDLSKEYNKAKKIAVLAVKESLINKKGAEPKTLIIIKQTSTIR